MATLYSKVVNNSILYTQSGNKHMKFTIELDTDNTLLDNLNAVEDSLRTHNIMGNTDNLVAITDNPLHDTSITIREDVTLTALGNQISVMPNADVTVDNTLDSAFENSINSSMLDTDDSDSSES